MSEDEKDTTQKRGFVARTGTVHRVLDDDKLSRAVDRILIRRGPRRPNNLTEPEQNGERLEDIDVEGEQRNSVRSTLEDIDIDAELPEDADIGEDAEDPRQGDADAKESRGFGTLAALGAAAAAALGMGGYSSSNIPSNSIATPSENVASEDDPITIGVDSSDLDDVPSNKIIPNAAALATAGVAAGLSSTANHERRSENDTDANVTNVEGSYGDMNDDIIGTDMTPMYLDTDEADDNEPVSKEESVEVQEGLGYTVVDAQMDDESSLPNGEETDFEQSDNEESEDEDQEDLYQEDDASEPEAEYAPLKSFENQSRKASSIKRVRDVLDGNIRTEIEYRIRMRVVLFGEHGAYSLYEKLCNSEASARKDLVSIIKNTTKSQAWELPKRVALRNWVLNNDVLPSSEKKILHYDVLGALARGSNVKIPSAYRNNGSLPLDNDIKVEDSSASVRSSFSGIHAPGPRPSIKDGDNEEDSVVDRPNEKHEIRWLEEAKLNKDFNLKSLRWLNTIFPYREDMVETAFLSGGKTFEKNCVYVARPSRHRYSHHGGKAELIFSLFPDSNNADENVAPEDLPNIHVNDAIVAFIEEAYSCSERLETDAAREALDLIDSRVDEGIGIYGLKLLENYATHLCGVTETSTSSNLLDRREFKPEYSPMLFRKEHVEVANSSIRRDYLLTTVYSDWQIETPQWQARNSTTPAYEKNLLDFEMLCLDDWFGQQSPLYFKGPVTYMLIGREPRSSLQNENDHRLLAIIAKNGKTKPDDENEVRDDYSVSDELADRKRREYGLVSGANASVDVQEGNGESSEHTVEETEDNMDKKAPSQAIRCPTLSELRNYWLILVAVIFAVLFFLIALATKKDIFWLFFLIFSIISLGAILLHKSKNNPLIKVAKSSDFSNKGNGKVVAVFTNLVAGQGVIPEQMREKKQSKYFKERIKGSRIFANGLTRRCDFACKCEFGLVNNFNGHQYWRNCVVNSVSSVSEGPFDYHKKFSGKGAKNFDKQWNILGAEHEHYKSVAREWLSFGSIAWTITALILVFRRESELGFYMLPFLAIPALFGSWENPLATLTSTWFAMHYGASGAFVGDEIVGSGTNTTKVISVAITLLPLYIIIAQQYDGSYANVDPERVKPCETCAELSYGNFACVIFVSVSTLLGNIPGMATGVRRWLLRSFGYIYQEALSSNGETITGSVAKNFVSFYLSMTALSAKVERCVFVISKKGESFTGLTQLCKLINDDDVKKVQREMNPYGVPIPTISTPGQGFDDNFLIRNIWGFVDFEQKDRYLISPIDPGFPSVVASSSGAMVTTAKLYEIIQSNAVKSEKGEDAQHYSNLYIFGIVLLCIFEFALYLPAFFVWTVTHLVTATIGIPVMILAALHALLEKCLQACGRRNGRKKRTVKPKPTDSVATDHGTDDNQNDTDEEGPAEAYADEYADVGTTLLRNETGSGRREDEASAFYIGGIVYMILEVLKVSMTLWTKLFVTTWILSVKALFRNLFAAHLVSTPKNQLYFLPPLGASEDRFFRRKDLFDSGAGYWQGAVKVVADMPVLGRTYPVSAVRLHDVNVEVYRSRVSGDSFEWPVLGGTADDVGLTE